ncbi:MAG: hypothetical protein HY692_08515, partial [Cyanobacteria bacterium NC_groundwater_1444_Ag_S-0.65um_54_12]|nr:hypothetical protein [Cyanobacteria bacterium NC_groundwater_1444_Ag_S-0.65um_54_12]
SRTIFLLLAQGITGILPTIVSRCQRIPFGLLGENTIAKWLVERHALTTECARDAARRSAGRIGRALALAQGAELPTSGILAKIDLLEALAEAEKIASLDSNEQNLLLEELIGQVRDVMILSRTGKADWIGQTELVQQLAQTRRSFGTWERIASKLESSRQRLLAGANAKLLWTVLAGYLTSTLANTD